MNATPQVLLFDAAEDAARTLRERLCERGLTPAHQVLADAAEDASWSRPDVAVVLIGDAVDRAASEQTTRLLERLVEEKVATLVWGRSKGVRWAGGPLVEWIDPNISLDEVIGRLSTLTRYVPLVKRFERELDHLHQLGDQLNRYFSEIDQEMRLAGRLQRDFLPRQVLDVPGLKLGVLYRPASWVSGDMYDVFRIDEHHTGFFIADAMGHGVAAGLLTMFLRQALVTKHVNGSSYSIVSPAAAMENLHLCLTRQKLPNCQFVTAVYAVYNHERRELRLSRGGHPYPLHIRAGGEIEPIVVGGSLLGLPDVPTEFDEARLTLQPGDKVIFFTDGLEDDFFLGCKSQSCPDEFTPILLDWAKLDAGEFVEAVREHLDGKEGSLHPADDITLLTLEVAD